MINPGNYKAKAVKASYQLGETEKGTLQVGVDLDVKDSAGVSLGQMTTFMYFSQEAAPYSFERLRALGWKGAGPNDVDNPDGIDANEVDVRVTQAESYKASDGTMKMGVSKLEILTGGGKVTITKKLDPGTFRARLNAVLGNSAGGGAPAPAASGAAKPPF